MPTGSVGTGQRIRLQSGLSPLQWPRSQRNFHCSREPSWPTAHAAWITAPSTRSTSWNQVLLPRSRTRSNLVPGNNAHAAWQVSPTQTIPSGQGGFSCVQRSSPCASSPGKGPLPLACAIQSPRRPLVLRAWQKFALQHWSQCPCKKTSACALHLPVDAPAVQPHRQSLGSWPHCCSEQGGQALSHGSPPTKKAQHVGSFPCASFSAPGLAQSHEHGWFPNNPPSHLHDAPQMPLVHSDHA
mmetsp:Transcript_134634/g.375213  ORF Transcript_134634/g.375213 Transcript_134634/m.375213 type:complete len:241 (-) Transcript_134634:774-1496(-)